MDEIKKSTGAEYIKVIKEDFAKYKYLGDKTFGQLNEEDIHFTPGVYDRIQRKGIEQPFYPDNTCR